MSTRETRMKLGLSFTLPQFQMCCAKGQTMLAPLKHMAAEEVRDLLIRNDAIAKEDVSRPTMT